MDPHTLPRSRRALLAAGLSGLAALGAQAFGRPLSARATHGDVHLGGTLADNAATSPTQIQNSTAGQVVLYARASAGGTALQGDNLGTSGRGVFGFSSAASGSITHGVYGQSYSLQGRGVEGNASAATGTTYGVVGSTSSDEGTGVFGQGGIGVQGFNNHASKPALVGHAYQNTTGVLGYSGSSTVPAAQLKTGVYGHAIQDSGSRGVWGRANAGRGVYGQATSGKGVYGTASSGTAAYFKGGDGTGKALNAQGRVFFRTAGLAPIDAGSSSSGAIAAGVDLVASSKILATLEGNPGAGVTIHRVTKSTAADTLTVYLTGPAANACKVAWFVIG